MQTKKLVRGVSLKERLRYWPDLAKRNDTKELLDESGHEQGELVQSFADIALFNTLFGGMRPLTKAIRHHNALTILDVGCGLADIPRALIRDARLQNQGLAVTCVDASEPVLELAKAASQDYPECRFVHGDGKSLPFADDSFDAAICSLTLHHCDPRQAVSLLSELTRVARNVFVADLHRCYGGYVGALVISRLFSRNRLTRNDAPLSVRRAYTPDEALQLARQAGWSNPQIRKTPYFRMLLTDAD